jgi:PleD family two-component response regulator
MPDPCRHRPLQKINDTGHLAGDEVLRQVGNLAEAGRLAKTLKTIVEKYITRLPSAGIELRISASFGVSVGYLGSRCWHDLISSADVALYRAKSHGRNRVHIATPPSRSHQHLSPLVSSPECNDSFVVVALRLFVPLFQSYQVSK